MIRILTVFLILALAPAAQACGGADACALDGRTYHAAPPPGWDGVTPLPVLIHFHGWGRRSSGVLNNKRVAAAAAAAGALLIAPQGRGRSWRFWSAGSDDSDFAMAVLDDAAARWPIDRDRVIVSGFSYGGAMAWRMACDLGPVVKAFLPIAGSLWRGDDRCAAPVRLTHVHGLKDTVMDYPYGPNGEVDAAVAIWTARNQCQAAPDQVWEQGRYTCRRWSSCTGPAVELCTHPGGHYIPKDWLAYALPRALAE